MVIIVYEIFLHERFRIDTLNRPLLFIPEYELCRCHYVLVCTSLPLKVVGLVSDAIADMMEGYFLRLWLNSQQPSQETEDTHMEMLQKLLAAKPQLKQTLSLDCNSVNPSHTLDLCTHYLCHGCLLGRSCEAAALVAGIPVPLFPMMSLLSHSIAMAVLWNLPLLRDQVGASTGHYYRIRALERLESFRDSNAKTLLQNYIASGGIMS